MLELLYWVNMVKKKSVFDEIGNIYYILTVVVMIVGIISSFARLYLKVDKLEENQKDSALAATELTKVETQLDDVKENLTRLDQNVNKIIMDKFSK